MKFKERLKIPSVKTLFYIFLFTFCAFSYDMLLGTYFYKHIIEGKLPVVSFTIPNASSIYMFFKLFLITPIYEEIFYRKIVFTKLKEHYSLQVSMIISSLFFAVGHLEFSIHLLSFFVVGLVLSYIYHKTNSVLIVVLLHAFYNIFNKFQKFTDIEFVPENYSYVFYYIVGFVGVYYSFKKLALPLKKDKDYFYFKESVLYKYFTNN